MKAIEEEKRLLQVKHEKLCAEFKNLKREINDLNFTNNASAIALKSAKKENKDASNNHEKKVKLLEEKIQELVEFRSEKLAEEKETKSRAKKVDKKIKQIEEREAKVKLKIIELKKEQDKTFEEKLDANENVQK